MSDSVENFIRGFGYLVGATLSALGVRHLFQFITSWRKTNLERRTVHTTSDLSIHDMQAADLKEYRDLFKQAEEKIRDSRRAWMDAEFLIREMLYKMKNHNVPGWEEDESKFKAMFAK